MQVRILTPCTPLYARSVLEFHHAVTGSLVPELHCASIPVFRSRRPDPELSNTLWMRILAYVTHWLVTWLKMSQVMLKRESTLSPQLVGVRQK